MHKNQGTPIKRALLFKKSPLKKAGWLGLPFLLAIGIAMPVRALGQTARLKNLAGITGVRSNKLIGYGLVFGLQGTGDSAASVSSRRAVAKMLSQLGMQANAEDVAGGNFAAVIATAELPPFARSGDRIDIRISATGDGKSLAGGTLLLTPLRAGDGKVYVVAQGAVVTGPIEGKGASVMTVATVPQGGVIEREYTPLLAADHRLQLSLKNADFTTNSRIVKRINEHFRGFYAKALDPATLTVTIPLPYHERVVDFIAQMEALQVEVDRMAVVVLNERTGTVVMGNDIAVAPITIAHGNLSIKVHDAKAKAEKHNSLLSLPGTTVGDVVASLNALGVKPKDLVAIIQAMHAAGALQGELKFI